MQSFDTDFDTDKVDAFAGQMLDVLNGGAIALMTAIGHRTGLFDTMAALPSATSEQIAQAAQLNERYVREWLNAMVTGRVVDYEYNAQVYTMPPEHAALLTRAASPDNLAVITQYIADLGKVEPQIIECFHNGGGVPYSAYTNFQQVMAEDSGQSVVAMLESAILPLVPHLSDALTQGIKVLDVGCGSGRALIKLAKLFPASHFTGYDFSAEGIHRARSVAHAEGLTNIEFHIQDAAHFNEVARYNLICTFDAIHDQARPDLVLQNIYRALRPDGIYLMQDIRASSHVDKNLDHPLAPMLYTISCMHCMTVSLAEGGMGLGTVWGQEKAVEMLNAAGFQQIDIKQLEHDPFNDYYIIHKQ
ncbi:MAG: class I SAM-dependent methyltransferase [Cyanobacteria bacterium P01_F01_bin.4]